jgi:hypothetical protein
MREMKTEVVLAATLRLSQPHADGVDGELARMWLNGSQHGCPAALRHTYVQNEGFGVVMGLGYRSPPSLTP